MGICDGLNVLELGSSSVAASMTGMVLADAGARVVKVEPPEGDRLRTRNPNGFRVWNRGKESVVADLRTDAGRAALLEMVDAADIVIEALNPGTMQRWGVGPDVLRARNPRLVHCHITAFGRTGPLSDIPGYDAVVAARAGLWARGQFGHRAGGLMYSVPWASFGAAMQSVAGIAGALLVRERTGIGQEVDATLWAGLEPLDYFVATVAQVMMKKAKLDSSAGKAGPVGMPGGATRFGVLLATRDGRFVQTSTVLPHQGKALCETAGLGHMLEDPRFQRIPAFATVEDAQEFEDALLGAFRQHDLDHWLPILLASPDIAFEVAITSEDGLDHPQIVHNGDVISIEDPEVGPVRQIGPLGHFSNTPMTPSGSSPKLGEHGGPFVANPATGASVAPATGTAPFSGLTIVEFGYFYAMPYGLAMAASMGARVIKIEDGKGDPHRNAFGQELATAKTTAGKESISLDLRSPDGLRIAREIIAGADVFVNGFRTGVAEKLGLGYDDLRAINPALLYVNATGYGTDGPYAHRALYAQAAQSVAGSFGRQVGAWLEPETNRDMSVMELQAIVLPRLMQVIDGDSNASLAVFAAVSLGAYHAARTNEGQRLRTSMIAGNALAYSDDFCTFAGKVPVTGTGDDFVGVDALDHLYEAAESSWLCLHVETDSEFAALSECLGGALLDDRFRTGDARREHDAELTELLKTMFAAKTAAQWQADLTPVGVGAAAVSLMGQAATTAFDPFLRQQGLTVVDEHPLFGAMVRAAPPLNFSQSTVVVGPSCQRGEQNRSVLAGLGYDDAAITQLEASGAVFPMTPVEALPAEIR